MALFGRGKNAKLTAEDPSVLGLPAQKRSEPDKSGYGRAQKGPFDASEASTEIGYVDLGAILVRPVDGVQLRLELEEATQRVVAVTIDLNGSNLQLQAFAAPRSEGLWGEIRAQIAQSVASQGGMVEETEGTFGPELIARLPADASGERRSYRAARFMGVDGPRWFLRGVLGGPAAENREASAELEDLFRHVVVDRGESPLPPRELLPLRIPVEAAPHENGPGHEEAPQAPERGPEITHLG
ncbi:hypothetical protein SCMU_18630 [Sinomonas cyclohexanicum]|uniref:DUF3710 domain-containing protein n=1 Tax=Sinomonas cyclohexanicum TaxID=322009 RepID=A0ABM7PUT3_SINCY|nr:DUF3710 domain-containing protein [Corynebacterium cyclohexanicum]BCT76021.1 hypothetical protein SCMU_18630 [Corynebacterium cyclohexanicum]